MGDRVIRVTGKAEASAPADRVVLRFDVGGWDREYAPAVELLNKRVDALRAALADLSVPREQLKTSNFRVNPTYESVSRFGREHRELSGYTAVHTVRLELPMDKDQLNRILAAVAEGESEPSIAIAFEVSDTSGLRQQALEDAVAEARRNAETLAKASGVALDAIRSIEYGWREVRVEVQEYRLPVAAAAQPASAPDLEPEDVLASETVTITWEIG
jgi:uncharacterized protein YggE